MSHTGYITSLVVATSLVLGASAQSVSESRSSGINTNLPLSAVFPGGIPQIKTNGPDAAHVMITSSAGGWSVAELYDTAARWLAKNKQVPEQVRTNASLWISPDNKDVMCCFRFTHPRLFGRPVWTVELGYDGKVKACTESIAVEAMPPGMKIPPPPPDPFINDRPEHK